MHRPIQKLEIKRDGSEKKKCLYIFTCIVNRRICDKEQKVGVGVGAGALQVQKTCSRSAI